MAKLSDRQKNNIIAKFKTGTYTKVSLAKEYNVDEASIRKILKGDFKGSDRQKGFLYIITSKEHKQNNIYKIGISYSVDTRIKQLQTGNPYKLYIEDSYFIEDIHNIEKTIHNFLNDDRLEGEWFVINECIIKRIKTYLNINRVENGEDNK